MGRAADAVVATVGGRVRGRATAHGHVFHAIPYAAAPIGAGRFAVPRPPAGWTGVRDATRPGPTAPQPRRDAFGVLDMSPYFGSGWVRGPEYPTDEYLTVDVRTPDVHGGPAPVMVFVHGGGFVAGSPQAPLYGGDAFARDGVVLVTVTYRLGIPGFLHLPDAPDNRGLLDVLAALRWVRDDIAAFGGDPGNVTVFGQSAGAILLGALVADDASTGLLRRAILQSGSGVAAFTREQARRVTVAAGAALGIPPTAAALSDVTDERLVEAAGTLAGLDLTTATHRDPLAGITPFGVVLDEQPAAGIAAGRGADVDLVVGSNADEANLYLAPLGRPTGDADPDLLAVFGDGSRRTAAAHAAAATGATYSYEFGWRSDAVGGRLGACHTVELPFVFDTVDLPALHGPNALLGTAPPPAGLAAAVHGAWTRFAATGDPGWLRYRPGAEHVHRFG